METLPLVACSSGSEANLTAAEPLRFMLSPMGHLLLARRQTEEDSSNSSRMQLGTLIQVMQSRMLAIHSALRVINNKALTQRPPAPPP